MGKSARSIVESCSVTLRVFVYWKWFTVAPAVARCCYTRSARGKGRCWTVQSLVSKINVYARETAR